MSCGVCVHKNNITIQSRFVFRIISQWPSADWFRTKLGKLMQNIRSQKTMCLMRLACFISLVCLAVGVLDVPDVPDVLGVPT